MPILTRHWINLRLHLLSKGAGPILSISGATLAVICIATGHIVAGTILAGVDLVVTRFAFKTKNRARNQIEPVAGE
jgi:hypothetical protein